jgi:serine O-acetyltransferase
MANQSTRFVSFSKSAVAAVSAIRLLPHMVVLMTSPKREILWKDLDRYGEVYGEGKAKSSVGRLILFINTMTFLKEYRNVFYLRHKTLGHFLGLVCRPMESLKINAKTCGSGLFVQHGFGTQVSAERIGDNCVISHLVTVGYVNNAVDRPSIGNNVTIAVGARVLGAVTVGDDAFVSANSVVISDVPPGATVIGVPARMVPSGARTPKTS